MRLRRLGRSELEVSVLGLGCWQFSGGSGLIGGFWDKVPDPTVDEIIDASIKGGINWFDTAEIYGRGESERTLSASLQRLGKKPGEVLIATKWWPFPRTASSIRSTIGDRLEALKPFPIDLHQIHQPWSFSTVTAEANAMAELVKQKKIRAVGVSNFNASRMRKAHAVLGQHGVPLASNQVLYSLIDRRIESNGIMAAAKELGVSIIAYSPLGQGILSGKFHEDPSRIASLGGGRRRTKQFSPASLERSRPLVEELKKIAQAHGVTPSQVALNWLANFHGDTVLVIPGASKKRQAEENCGSTAFTLTPAELQRIDELSARFK